MVIKIYRKDQLLQRNFIQAFQYEWEKRQAEFAKRQEADSKITEAVSNLVTK